MKKLLILLLLPFLGNGQEGVLMYTKEKCLIKYEGKLWTYHPCISYFSAIFITTDSVFITHDLEVESYKADSAVVTSPNTFRIFCTGEDKLSYKMEMWKGDTAATFTVIGRKVKYKYKLIRLSAPKQE